ncbi:uncharacterized protein P884DRAFT_224216 [Thermothelomyces heterothallicus CBS 202.75]|uniref:uncharacterized protein n=1 Tax=Thermothelomyces heterothallicus CBS 202.75 TaxID=1149848 RepID=UPI003743B6A2
MPPPEPFTVITRVPIPASLPPDAVLAALRAYEPIIKPNPYLDRYERRSLEAGEEENDPFFRADGQNAQAFVVHERVPIIPGVGSWATKQVAIPCVFQSFEHGVRCCAHAQGGVTVRSSYEVRRRGEVADGPEPVSGPGDGDYELVDISSIECGALIKPFVKMRFSSAHQALLEQIIRDLAAAPNRWPGQQ